MSPWRQRGLILCCWLLAVALGAVHVWSARHSMNADGMSYLDLADAWRTGRWSDAVNAYWSPGYSWLLAIALIVFNPSGYWEAAIAHLVNFAGYLLALACFHYFWMGLRRQIDDQWQGGGRDNESTFPEWAWIALGFSLCAWILLSWITVDIITPDLYVAAFVFLDAGLLARIRGGRADWRSFLVLGISLGLGYLTKAILLPMAAVFIVTALLAAPRRGRTIPRLAVTIVVFALLAGPWTWALSKAKGRFTMGETGKMNYAAQVNGFYPWDVWQGAAPPPGCGKPKHPVRQVLDKPPVFEFAKPLANSCTYPVWYDPSYWHDGVQPYFSPRLQARVLADQVKVYCDMFFRDQGPLTFVMLLLLLMRGRWGRTARDLLSMWWVVIPSLAALGAYALVHVEHRYIAPFMILLWSAVLPLVRLPRSDISVRVIGSATAAVLIGIVLMIGSNTLPACKEALADVRSLKESRPNGHWATAEAMRKAGLRPGDHVGHIGQVVKSWSYWARLAGVRITAELRPWESFWLGDDATRARVLDVFASKDVKVRAVVTRKQEIGGRPFGLPYDFAPGWTPVGTTQFYIRFLDKPASAPASQPTRPSSTSMKRIPRPLAPRPSL